ncbi:MAG: PilZ domain-containing protein [Rhodanobacter sp.]
MTAENEDQAYDHAERLRSARMPFETTVLMSRGTESRSTTLINISATGASLRRPLDWSGAIGQEWVLDMIFGQELHIHLEATVVRVRERDIGFSYSNIPEEKQVPLWDLLGGYADTQEQWSGD